jgi:hypothetical protein
VHAGWVGHPRDLRWSGFNECAGVPPGNNCNAAR